MTKLIISLALTLFANLANAASFTVFENNTQCENVRKAGFEGEGYVPQTKAPFKGGPGWTRMVVPAGGACLGEAHIMEDGAPRNGKSVYVAPGFVYWVHVSGSYRMEDCSNPFGSILFLAKKDESKSEPDKPAAAEPACTTDDCGNTVKYVEQRLVVTPVTQIMPRRCIVEGREIALTNGECVGPESKVILPVKVDTKVDGCGEACNPTPKFNPTGKVARTDGRCVVHVTSKGGFDHYIRLSPEKGTGRLMASIVADKKGDFDKSLPIVYVGDDNGALHANPNCNDAYKGYTGNRSYAPTMRRLKLDNCVVRGLV